MQKINAQLPINPSKKPYSQSFGTDRSSSLLNQFILKTKQVLVDDLKVRKVYQSVRPISQSYKSELKQFMKHFSSKPKDQFIELCNHLIEKYVDLANLKIYLWYFRQGKEIGNWQDAFVFCGLLDSFSQSILSEESQKQFNKSLQTQETRSKKPSLDHADSVEIFQDICMSPVQKRLKKQESLPEQTEVSVFEGTKEAKDILKPLDKLFESLSKGDLQEAGRQKFPVSVGQKLREKREKFVERCKVIKRVIEYLNSLIPSCDRVKPEVNLSSLQKCMEKISKNGNKSKKGQKQITVGSIGSSKDKTNKESESIQSLQKALSQAQKLFNDKSMELSMQKIKSGREMNELNCRWNKMNEQSMQLREEVQELKRRLQQKQRQIFNMREDYFAKLKQKCVEYELGAKQQMRRQLLKQTTIIDDLRNQFESSYESTNLKQKPQDNNTITNLKQKPQEETILKLNRLVQALKSQKQQLRTSLSQLQSKITMLQKQNHSLSQQITKNQTQTTSHVNTLTAKITTLQQAQAILKNQNIQLQDKLSNLNISLNQQTLKLQAQSQHYQNIVYNALKYIKINSCLQSSQILPPFPFNTITQSLLNNSSFLSQQNPSKKQDILYEKKLTAIVQKQFLVREIQKYVSQIQQNPKVKAFKLIYRFNSDIKSNFHQFIDQKPCFLVLVKLKSGAVIGGYSHQPLKKGLRTQFGFIFSLSLLESYFLRDKHCLVYDDYYLIFGNSQIRIRIGQNLFYSNFGITKASFQVHDRKFTDFLMVQNQREQVMEYFQVYQLSFDSD